MLSDLVNRVKKMGQPPGTAIYTGTNMTKTPVITVIHFGQKNYRIQTASHFDECDFDLDLTDVIWVNIEGLHDINLINAVTNKFNIHPLTIEDIVNIEQRPKMEAFDQYAYITLKSLQWNKTQSETVLQQLSIVFGKQFILTFEEIDLSVISQIRLRLQSPTSQHFREQGSDYLVYRIIDSMVDEYFSVLENVGERIEHVEQKIIGSPNKKTSSIIYRLKRQMLILRKAIWPLREVMSHLLYEENEFVTSFTRIYLRDAYDHTVQAIDTVETFRDMISSLLDMYLSSLTIRTNEIMKTLTIITTIFIPITALASIYGMNLPDIPLMKSPLGFLTVALMMISSVTFMIIYFRRKKWI